MLNTVLEKLKSQQKNAGPLEIQIGEYLMALCQHSPAAAELMAESSQTLKECEAHLTDHARRNQKGGKYIMTQEALGLINEFYGLTGPEIPQPRATFDPEVKTAAPGTIWPAPKSSAIPAAPPSAPPRPAPPVINILDFLD